jgi:hypothetical protein
MSERGRQQRVYDHRLRSLVRETGDLGVATTMGVPSSTARGWLRAQAREVVSLDVVGKREEELTAEIVRLRRRVRILGVVVGLLLAVLRISGFKLEARRLPVGRTRSALLRRVERAREILPLSAILLNTLDSVAAVRRLVTFYVAAHNGEIPHSAFRGQTPDEMYFRMGAHVTEELEAKRKEARAARLEQNRTTTCQACSGATYRAAAAASAAA